MTNFIEPLPGQPLVIQMRGKNSMVLCTAEMAQAVEFYLNSVVFKVDVRVTDITWKDNTFTINLVDQSAES